MIKTLQIINTLIHFLRLIRWQNLLIIIATQYLARICLVGGRPISLAGLADVNQLLITLGTIFIAAAGYIINDYFDVKIDLINKPDKVVIGRFIPRRYAILIHQVLNIAGAVIGFAVSFKVFLVNILAISTLWFYASVFKRKMFVGNFLVAGLTGAALVAMAVFYKENDLLINIYSLFAFGISLIREIIKDIEDIRGDQRYGSNTLPIILGLKSTKKMLYVLIALFVLGVLLLSIWLGNSRLYVVFALLSLPMAYLTYRLVKADRKQHFAHLSDVCKVIMVLGVLSMLAI